MSASHRCTSRETVFEVGADGGSIVLWRERMSGEEWKFGVSTNEAAISDVLSEEDAFTSEQAAQPGYGNSFREGLALLDTNRCRWFGLYPVEIHPDYFDAVLLAVRERGGATAEGRWREALGLFR